VIRIGSIRMNWQGAGLDSVGVGWTWLDSVRPSPSDHSGEQAGMQRGLVSVPSQGVFYPSTLLVWKHLQKFDPSGHSSEAVSEPSGFWLFTRYVLRIMEHATRFVPEISVLASRASATEPHTAAP
jgi:hypothetical protein